jgi:tRNA A-37 threonylcarbamoyl transferase component Bud32
LTKPYWTITDNFTNTPAAALFASIDAVFELEGEKITGAPISEVIKVNCNNKNYYVKRYTSPGGMLSKWFGSSRILGEWKNLVFFQKIGISTPPIVAYGETGNNNYRGCVITEEVNNTVDLSVLAETNAPELRNKQWLNHVSQQIADAARKMHQQEFAHNDLKWRNILVTKEALPTAYFIDCPVGRFWWGPFLQHRIIKDIACMDKVAKFKLSRTQRLRFYLQYQQKSKLDINDKKVLKKIVHYFDGAD